MRSLGDQINAAPFLRWAGGKQWLAPRLAALLSRTEGDYFEPFLGGGSCYFALRPPSATLSDVNLALIETYCAVRDDVETVASILERWRNTESDFYKVRSRKYSTKSERAAQFIYLNKTCWNGLHRVNKAGIFNVPFGRNTNRRIFDSGNLAAVSVSLSSTNLICCDFEEAVRPARSGDAIYFDPPYILNHSENGFRRYNETLFSWEDQLRLARVASSLAERGCHVLVTNANHLDVVKLYPEFDRIVLTRKGSLAADPKYRVKTTELLLCSFKLQGQIEKG